MAKKLKSKSPSKRFFSSKKLQIIFLGCLWAILSFSIYMGNWFYNLTGNPNIFIKTFFMILFLPFYLTAQVLGFLWTQYGYLSWDYKPIWGPYIFLSIVLPFVFGMLLAKLIITIYWYINSYRKGFSR